MIENAKWISANEAEQAPCIKKFFTAGKIKKALLQITGLGYFYVKINGKNVTRDLFNPVFSDYRERSFKSVLYPMRDKTSHRVYYCQYNVEKFLKEGGNSIAVYLGNGWYRQSGRTAEGHLEFGERLIARFSLSMTDREGKTLEILSDGSESWTSTEVVKNNIFYGEVQDARRMNEKPIYYPVAVEKDFDTEFSLQECPAEGVVKKIRPALIKTVGKRRIYDVGETVSGWVKIKAKGKSGEVITVNHSELLKEDSELQVNSVGGCIENDRGEPQLQIVRYILDGKTRYYRPRFCRQAFRYFETNGEYDGLTVEVVHSLIKERTSFSCDNGVINWLYEAYKRTQLVNMHDGIPSDCPHRERLGYTGDGQITASAAMTFFDCKSFYRKWIQDIIDCQDTENGHIQHTAPYYGGGGGPVGWGCAVVQVPYAFYRHYADKETVKKAFPHAKKWVDYIVSRSENDLVCREEEGGWCLGDWSAIGEMKLPQEFVNSSLFVRNLQKMAYLAKEIGEKEEIPRLCGLIDKYKSAIVNKYFDKQTGSFCGGVQGADAFALSIGLGSRKTKENLIGYYTENCFFDTGFLGTYQLIEYLLKNGCVDQAFDLLASERKGSFGYLKTLGENTICERLEETYASHCHPMFGGVAEFLLSVFLGFPENNDKKSFTLAPEFPGGLSFARGSMIIGGEKVCVSWKKTKGKVVYRVVVPAACSVKVKYKKACVRLHAGVNRITLPLGIRSGENKICEEGKCR